MKNLNQIIKADLIKNKNKIIFGLGTISILTGGIKNIVVTGLIF